MAAASKEEMSSRVPIIAIVGATGTGKTKLSVELAKRIGGEIINADSMQVYSGLDILTNKATVEEQCGVPHHLLGHLKPGDNYNVHRFRRDAFEIIERLHSQNKVPVVVGGTHYYVESLLWKNLVGAASGSKTADSDEDEGGGDDHGGGPRPRKRPHLDADGAGHVIAGRRFANLEGDLERLSTAELRDILKEVDPVSWRLRHDSDRRKIMRSVQVFGQTGRRHSDILEEQRRAAGSVYGGALRYPNALVYWVQCEKEVLRARLTKRVDEMLERGLVAEAEAFHREVNLGRGEQGSQEFEHSLFQSIGFKELIPFLLLPPSERDSDRGRKVLEEGVNLIKCRTMRYAGKQETWIRNRLLVHGRDVPPVWPLNATDPARWDELVSTPALAVLEARLRGEDPDEAVIRPLPKEGSALPPEERHMTYHCAPCGRALIGLQQYEIHLAGKKHRHRLASLRRLQQDVVDSLDALVQRGKDEEAVEGRSEDVTRDGSSEQGVHDEELVRGAEDAAGSEATAKT